MNRGDGHQTETPDVSHIRNVEVTHEASNINVSAVVRFLVVLTLVTVVVSAGLWFLFKFLNKQEEIKERPPGPLALRNLSEEQRLPPEPRLQGQRGFGVQREDGQRQALELTHPQAEYEVLLQHWQNALNSGLKDASGQTVGMPIEEAMKRVTSGEGLPV